MTLGKKIRCLREKNGYEQKELASKLGHSTGLIAEWESNETTPSIVDITNLCSLFSVSADYFLIENGSDSVNHFNDGNDDDNNQFPLHKSIEKVPNKKNRWKKWLFLSLALLLILSGVFAICKTLPQILENFSYKEKTPSKIEEEKTFHENSDAIEIASKSVVKIYCYNKNNEELATGSGFIAYSPDIVITNYHVIKNASYCTVSTEQNITIDVKGVICFSKEKDIAVLKLAKIIDVSPLKIGNSIKMKKGDPVVAVGSPLGLKNTVSEGILSGRVEEEAINALQFTASISSGSSGGALFNDMGEVIGITYASYIDGQNLNLAIPIEYVDEIYNLGEHNIKSFSDLFEDDYTESKANLAKWIKQNGEVIDFSVMGLYNEAPIPEGFYVEYYDDNHEYCISYHTKEDKIQLSSYYYPEQAIYPHIYIVSIPIDSSIANYCAYEIDVYETAEILITAIGEMDTETFDETQNLYCTEYNAYNDYFGYCMPWGEYEEIYRLEICNLISCLEWALENEGIGITLADIGFTIY